ncbi:MAG: DnaB-like helicase N-terminal domain-containing protein [Rhodococcus sp. (in: high G+C Gram-positive bacteria)]
MTPLRAVETTDDDDHADLTDHPETAPEALVICALMWLQDTDEAARIAATLQANDFHDPVYRDLYGIVQEQIVDNRPHDPASVLGVLVRSGASGHRGARFGRTLTDVTAANACGASATDYAGMVLSVSYRRSFFDAGIKIQQLAEEAPEADLSAAGAVVVDEHPLRAVTGMSLTVSVAS